LESLPLLDVWSFLIDSGKMTGVIVVGGGLTLLVLFLLLYPISKDT
jgi:hypothetical protein